MASGGLTRWLRRQESALNNGKCQQSEITKLESTGKVITDLTINSPVSGYITERNALPNSYVQPETKLYTVADLSTIWVYSPGVST